MHIYSRRVSNPTVVYMYFLCTAENSNVYSKPGQEDREVRYMAGISAAMAVIDYILTGLVCLFFSSSILTPFAMLVLAPAFSNIINVCGSLIFEKKSG